MVTKKQQLDELRTRLLKQLRGTRLQWHQVELNFRASVEVCPPLSVSVSNEEVKEFDLLFPLGQDPAPPIYVPVMKLEAWELAADTSRLFRLPGE